MSHRRVNRERQVEREGKTCRFCGRNGTQGFKKWDGHWICKSGRACLGRAKIGGYR